MKKGAKVKKKRITGFTNYFAKIFLKVIGIRNTIIDISKRINVKRLTNY